MIKEKTMFKLTTVMSLLLLLASCAATSSKLNPSTPVSVYGVASHSPVNGSWSLISATGYQLILGAKVAHSGSGIINMSLYQIPEFTSDEEFLSYVAKHRATSPDIGRFELKSNAEKLVDLNGATCVKHNTSSQDNHAKIGGNKSAVMQMKYVGFNCIHPFKKTVGVHIEYSLRYFEGKAYPELDKGAEEFFSNIKFKVL